MALKIALLHLSCNYPSFIALFVLKSNVSDYAISAVLLQYTSSEGYPLLPVAFYSKKKIQQSKSTQCTIVKYWSSYRHAASSTATLSTKRLWYKQTTNLSST